MLNISEELLLAIENAAGDRPLQVALLDTFALGIRDAERDRVSAAVEALPTPPHLIALGAVDREAVLGIVHPKRVTPLTRTGPAN